MAAAYDPVQQAFESASRDFRSNLGDDELYQEILKSASIDEVYNATDKLQAEQANKGHLRHLSKIGPFLEGLRGYADVIEVFMQAKPDVLALIWGPVKLILQWTSVLKQSFDAVVNTIAEIGVLLPEFRGVAKLFDHNKHIQEVLILFFKDILDFYFIALKFFSLSRWKYLFESLWPRHREKIKVVTDHIARLALLLRNEVRLEHIQAEHSARARALEHFDRAERSHRRQEYKSIEADISPKTYGDALYRFRARIAEEAAKWLIEDTTFNKWLDLSDTSTKVLWLEGIPGAGKTFLSCTVTDEARTLGLVIFTFLSYTLSSTTTALSIIQSLIFQLASNHEDLQAVLTQSSHEDLKYNIDSATRLLTTLAACAGPVYFIIDGLDEVEELERGRFLKRLLGALESCKDAKILVSSRPEADLEKILEETATRLRVDHRNAQGIKAYVDKHTKKWFRDREFLPEAEMEIKNLLAPLPATAKGMFLYAKIVLSNIQQLEVHEICQELQVLPESLDDAYGRILVRVNSLHPPKLKEKARKLLGWIGCSPTALTIQEMEQALVIDPQDLDGDSRVQSRLNVTKICGPIVEIVGGFVQFVHFTVKEYLFHNQITGFIDDTVATLSLATTCIAYLCQPHHGPELRDEEIEHNTIAGVYRLHDFAASTWFELVEKLAHLGPSYTPPNELVNLLEILSACRMNESYNSALSSVAPSSSFCFGHEPPAVYEMLCRMSQFRKASSGSVFHKGKGTEWINLDPLTISSTSIRIDRQLDQLLQLLCHTSSHKTNCHCGAIEKHYGAAPFKCGFLSCPDRRYRFENRALRDAHETRHDRPWKCTFPGCAFADGGFLSRKMRDDHLDRFHAQNQTGKSVAFGELHPDEIEPLFFDLVKADHIDAVEASLEWFEGLRIGVKNELYMLVASTGSVAMLRLITPVRVRRVLDYIPEVKSIFLRMLECAIQGSNMEAAKFLIAEYFSHFDDTANKYDRFTSHCFAVILRADSEEMVEELLTHLKIRKNRSVKAPPGYSSISSIVIGATAGQPNREEMLLQLWMKFDLPNSFERIYVGDALVNVASTTCSVYLAKFLLDSGAKVDHRRSKKYITPLHYAAKNTSLGAAEFMRLLLLHGADPEPIVLPLSLGKGLRTREVGKIRDEEGARGISKWLGKSWDELLAEAKEERERWSLLDCAS
ncbi:hypothetical protein EV356DRAFT_504364 [Viridothelium virens]|uniref:NACHT domain-containing protein n=1 Tax=Viridothelium virens TaxID=1048519 RepID=A0A6A6HMI2_VIRVR|nr:hypothetical protein EV356DRAFT_504364 [Viridothelium virens]